MSTTATPVATTVATGAPTRMLLVDGTNLAMRCAFGGAVDPQRAVQVATGMLARAVLQLRPTHAVVCFDPIWTEVPNWRRAAYTAYKATRTTDTTPYIVEASSRWERRGWFCVATPGFEADDVIATIAERVKQRARVVVLSNDSDLLSLAQAGVTVARPAGPTGKAGHEFEVLTAGDVAAKYGIPSARLLPDYKAMVGETSDNLPGVLGVGQKKAAQLLCKYGALEAVIRAGATGACRESRRVYEHAEVTRLVLQLVTLRTDAPVPPIAPKRCAILTDDQRDTRHPEVHHA